MTACDIALRQWCFFIIYYTITRQTSSISKCIDSCSFTVVEKKGLWNVYEAEVFEKELMKYSKNVKFAQFGISQVAWEFEQF